MINIYLVKESVILLLGIIKYFWVFVFTCYFLVLKDACNCVRYFCHTFYNKRTIKKKIAHEREKKTKIENKKKTRILFRYAKLNLKLKFNFLNFLFFLILHFFINFQIFYIFFQFLRSRNRFYRCKILLFIFYI